MIIQHWQLSKSRLPTTLRTALLWAIAQRVVVITYRILRITYLVPAARDKNPCPLNMGPINCPETSVRNYHYSLCNSPQERSSHLPCGGSLKWRLLTTLPNKLQINRVVSRKVCEFAIAPHSLSSEKLQAFQRVSQNVQNKNVRLDSHTDSLWK